MSAGVSSDLGKETAREMAGLVRQVMSEQAIADIIAAPRFGEVSLVLLDNWGPHAEDDVSMTRTLRDVGHYMAGILSMALGASPQGITHASLSQLIDPQNHGSRTRVHAMLVYLQFIGLLTALPKQGDGRLRRFGPTPALTALLRARFKRELAISLPLVPQVRTMLDRWEEPGLFEAFITATARFMLGAGETYDHEGSTLNPISQRNAGLIVMGQLVCMAGGDFPPGAVQVNLNELAKRSGVSRQQARNILKVGEQAAFWRGLADGRLAFSADFQHQVQALVACYVLHLAWCAEAALAVVGAAAPLRAASSG